jgi:DNA-directed RNA polymerase subunit RPC12/RpoP
MAEKNDPPPIVRCRRCGHTCSVPQLSAIPDEEPSTVGRCPNCGSRTLILTIGRPEKNIRIS